MAETKQQLQVHPSNADQARAWDGEEGNYWAANAERFDQSVAAYHQPFLDAARIRVNDRVLDIGCGTGQTTRDAARRASDGFAVGVDLSAAMIEYARRRASDEGVENARFEQGDAQVYPFPDAGFDLAMSRTGAMFFGDPHTAFINIARALRSGGRLTLLTWRPPHDNEWFLSLTGALAAGRKLPSPSADAPGPFSLADPDLIRERLHAAGFIDVAIDPLTEPMWFGATTEDAAQFTLGLLGWMLVDLDSDQREQAIDALRAIVAAHETPQGVTFNSGTWIVTAQRT